MTPKEFGLGRNPSIIDGRDYKLAAFMPSDLGDLSGSNLWPFNGALLDQGDQGHCTGFGGGNFEINDPVNTPCTNAEAHRLYYLCKDFDGEPGAENGSTVRSIAKVLRSLGRISNYAFAVSTDEISYWLLHNGPVIVGTEWYEGMFLPDADNVIHPTGQLAGGHCFLLNAVCANQTYQIHNSWGDRWGVHGEALISVTDFAALFEYGGEALAAVELPLSDNKGCLPALMEALGSVLNRKGA